MSYYSEFRERDDRDKTIFPFYMYEIYGYPGPVVPVHWHDEIEILYPMDPGRLLLDGRSIRFEKGDVLFVDSRQLHGTYLDNGGLVYHILISSKVPTFSQGGFVLPEIIKNAGDRYIEIMNKLVTYHTPVINVTDQFDILSSLYGMLSMISDDRESLSYDVPKKALNDQKKSYVIKCMDYIYNNITEDINMIAENVGISKAYLMRTFKIYTGGTLGSYIMDVRLDEAERDIRHGDGISEIAYRYHFSDTAHFCKRFKERFGCSPGKYLTLLSSRS